MVTNFIFVLNYAYLSSWLFIVVNVGWKYVRSKGIFGLTHVLFRKKTYFQCCSWIFLRVWWFWKETCFLILSLAISGRWKFFWKFLRFILWEIQDLCSKSEGQSLYLTLFLLLEAKGDTVNLFIPNISLVSLHTVYHKLIIILVLRIWYWIEW